MSDDKVKDGKQYPAAAGQKPVKKIAGKKVTGPKASGAKTGKKNAAKN